MFRLVSKPMNNRLYLYKFCVCHAGQQFRQNLAPKVLVSDLKIQKYSDLLSSFGFNPGQISRIFKSSHSILSLKEDELSSNLVNWLTFDVKDKLFTSIASQPELLTLNPEYVNSRAKELMTIFTKTDVNKLLITCPQVFLDEFSSIYEKVQYIVHHMHVEQKSIVKSCALQFDLFHVKCRHNFMSRAGRFIVQKKSVKCRNPPLNKIFSRNMDTFLKLTGLTEEEYLVFANLYMDEIECEDEESDYEDLDE